MMGLTTPSSHSRPSRDMVPAYGRMHTNRRTRRSYDDAAGGCFGLGLCEFIGRSDNPREDRKKPKSYLSTMFTANRLLTSAQLDDDDEQEEIVRLTDQLDKLKRAKEHVTYGPTKKRLDSKIKQLQTELDEVVETVLVG